MTQYPVACSISEAGVIKGSDVQNKAQGWFLSLSTQEPQLEWSYCLARHEGSVTVEQKKYRSAECDPFHV